MTSVCCRLGPFALSHHLCREPSDSSEIHRRDRFPSLQTFSWRSITMQLWSDSPGVGMLNTLTAKQKDDVSHQVELTLTVSKPGSAPWKSSVSLPLSLDFLSQAMKNGKWIPQPQKEDGKPSFNEDDTFKATRTWRFQGNPNILLVWNIEHRNRGTEAAPNYVINDHFSVVDLSLK